MVVEVTDTHYKMTVGQAGYAIRKDDTSYETFESAAEFLSVESRQSVTVAQIMEAINAIKA